MADRATYLSSNDEPISAQRRRELGGQGITGAVQTVGAVSAFLLLRKKINLSRNFSSKVRGLGSLSISDSKSFSRYELTDMIRDKNASTLSRWNSIIRNWYEGVKAPIPGGIQQQQMNVLKFSRHLPQDNPRAAAFSGILPGVNPEEIKKWGAWKTFWKGPIQAIAPNTPFNVNGKQLSVGQFGGIVFNDSLYRIGERGEVRDIIRGVRAGVVGRSGERIEFLNTFSNKIKEVKTLRDFAETRIPSRGEVLLEHKRALLEKEIRAMGNGIILGKDSKDAATGDVLREVIEKYQRSLGLNFVDMEFGGDELPLAYEIFNSNKDALEESVRISRNYLIKKEMAKKSTNLAYRAYKLQMKFGVSEAFIPTSAGHPNEFVNKLKEAFETHHIDFHTGRRYPIRSPRYVPEDVSISGFWGDGIRGDTYLYAARNDPGRSIADSIEGTLWKQAENSFGVGITTRHSFATRAISRMVGASEGSLGDYFIRRYIGTFLRFGLLSFGGYAAFRAVNLMARQASGGWGITDVAGKMYTSAREFQQKTLDHLGLIDKAKDLEHTYPGLVNSPLSRVLRATAPYWMTRSGGKFFGRRGAGIGLAMGLALSLLTWGDITQDPEELHRIYTGEQDIPVRRGRWWQFGKTPFEGGKIAYWRPHWYPLMRSKYKYQGQLWDSEKEEIANTGILSPILSPMLTGKAWDPYYWEKKHYKDRPYLLTGELFEPTMPFSWLFNSTIGALLKPQKIMHPEYWGREQAEPQNTRTLIPGASKELGLQEFNKSPMLPSSDPRSLQWAAGEAAYTISEQMGIKGFLLNTLYEDITGRPDFLPNGPVIQSARGAYGYERAYWDLDIGDPTGHTEFLRRILPHKRRAIEEYNPVPNQMPDWLPGEDYFVNFKIGDPYTKIPLGEARLPGAGYESLHHLHSGIPKVYDAVDRFLILSDIAPYSKEYREYSYLARSMTKHDPYWSEIVKRHISQRAKTQQEFEFLELEPPEDIKGIKRSMSKLYRKTISKVGAGGMGGVIEPAMGSVFLNSPFPFVMSPVSKVFPYRTAVQTYRDFRLQGNEFTEWGNPMRDFVKPAINKSIDMLESTRGNTYVPPEELRRREYEEYFDRLQYVKYKRLEKVALSQGNEELASQFSKMAKKTMTGVNPFTNPMQIMGAIPKRERAFLQAFIDADPEDRNTILQMVPKQMGEIYKAQWAIKDNLHIDRYSYNFSRNKETIDFFRNHTLPDNNWLGWNPDIDLKDVQLKVVKNEGMNIHNFDLWESQERAMARKTYVPIVESIHKRNDNLQDLKRELEFRLEESGYKKPRVYASKTPAYRKKSDMQLNITKNRDKEIELRLQEALIGD